MSNKDLCLSWLEWFKEFVSNHDIVHSSLVLATTNKEYIYHIYTTHDEIVFESKFVFTYKANKKKTISIPHLVLKYTLDQEEYMYKQILERIVRQMIYGKDFASIANILTGNAVINWQSNKEDQYTLKDILEKEYGPKRN